MTLSTYAQYQDKESSEKIGLVILEAAKRLMGWVLHSGSIYKLENFDHSVIVGIEDSGTALTRVMALGSVTAGKYYLDRQARTLYLRASDSSNPNSRFLACIFRLFFSNAGGVHLPHDLPLLDSAESFDVDWLALLKDTSDFGVDLDNQNQIGVAIEGSGSIDLINDHDFWVSRYDKFTFENQRAFVYSWTRGLPSTQAKIIFRGRIQSKSYDEARVKFQVKDFLNEMRAPVPLSDIGDVVGARVPANLERAKQRRIYGYVYGHRPTNIDQILDGYPLAGTIAIGNLDTALVGTSTQFRARCFIDDELSFDGGETRYTIKGITDDTHADLSEEFEENDISGVTPLLIPKTPNRFLNREFIVAGHALREPSTTVVDSLGLALLEVDSALDIEADDELIVNGENTQVLRVSGAYVALQTSLLALPLAGATVIRPAVMNVRLNDRKLVLDRDYSYSAALGTLTLDPLAEFNVAPIQNLTGTSVQFTNGSRTATGVATFFKSDLKRGDWIRAVGQSDWFEVHEILSDTSLLLRTAATYSVTTTCSRKVPEIYDGTDAVVLYCDVLGGTEDGTTDGALLKTAPTITRDLLIQAGLGDFINEASFTEAAGLAEHRLGLVIPAKYNEQKSPTIRETIDRINQSVFGSLIQNSDFELEYSVLRPSRPETLSRLKEFDILKFAITSKSDKISKTIKLQYLPKEFDQLSRAPSISESVATSDPAQYLSKSTKEQIIATVLVDEWSAQIFAARWALLLEVATSAVRVETKLQGARLEINDKVEIQHRKLYQRIGSELQRKIGAVQSSRKSVRDSSIELEDLANSFSRCGTITANDALPFDEASDQERAQNGYITDTYGMQDNDPDTFGINLIW